MKGALTTNRRRLGPALAALLVALGCGGRPADPGVAVTMKGSEVAYEAFEAYLAEAIGEREATMASDVLTGLFDQFLDEILLRRWAEEEMELTAAPGGDVLLALLGQLPTRGPENSEIRDYFEQHRDVFQLRERVRLRQILVDKIGDARRAHGELRSGADFAVVADRYARHAYTPPGGDQGVLAREDLPPAFEEVVFALEAGAFSAVIPTDYGFYIFQVVERLPARSVAFVEARPEIERQLQRQAVDAELVELVDKARNRYNVRVHRENLPFDYDGRYLSSSRTTQRPDNEDD